MIEIATINALESALERAFSEIAHYRSGLEDRLKLPLILDLISFYHLVAYYREDTPSNEHILNIFEVEILNALSRQGITPVAILPGQGLDRATQRPVAVEPCHTPEEDLRVVRVIRPGFTSLDGIITKAEVVVKRYQEVSP